jgi:hypothetical protein
LNRNGGSLSCFDAFSSREPVSTPDHVRGSNLIANRQESALQGIGPSGSDPLRAFS